MAEVLGTNLKTQDLFNDGEKYASERLIPRDGASAGGAFLRPCRGWQAADRVPALTRWAIGWRPYGAERIPRACAAGLAYRVRSETRDFVR
jgi:hypothetical protein